MRIEQKLTIPLVIVIIGNIIIGIQYQKDLAYYISFVGFFFFIIALLQIKEIYIPIKKIKVKMNISKIILSYILLVFSIGSMSTIHPSALNDILFFTLSLYLSRNSKKVYWTYGIIYLSILLFRYIPAGSSEFIVHLAGCSLVFIIYQHYVHPKKGYKKVIQKDYLISPVKKEIVDIMHLIIEGFDYYEINDKLELNITSDRVRRKVNEEVKRLGFNNREHMIFFLTEKGIIKSISYDLDTKKGSHDIL